VLSLDVKVTPVFAQATTTRANFLAVGLLPIDTERPVSIRINLEKYCAE
jgi:hypothetical protein